MADRRPNPRGAGKPPGGAILDFAHPLALGLVAAFNFADGAGLQASESCGCPNATLGAGVTWSAFGNYTGLKQPITSAVTTAPDTPAFNPPLLSAFVLVSFHSLNGTNNNHIFNRTAAVAGFRIYLNPNGPNMKAYVSDGATSLTATTAPSTIKTFTLYHFGLTFDGKTLRGYLNGQANGTASGTPALNLAATNLAFMNLGSGPASTAAVDGWLHQALLYNRPLAADHVALLAADPFGMFLPERQQGSVTGGLAASARPFSSYVPETRPPWPLL